MSWTMQILAVKRSTFLWDLNFLWTFLLKTHAWKNSVIILSVYRIEKSGGNPLSRYMEARLITFISDADKPH